MSGTPGAEPSKVRIRNTNASRTLAPFLNSTRLIPKQSTTARPLGNILLLQPDNGESPANTGANTPALASPQDKIAADERLREDSNHSGKPGGYCPDIEPSLITW